MGNYAKKPFYINLSDIYLYSIEELCYYFIDKDGYVGTYLPIFNSEENEIFLKKFKNNIINIKEFLTIK